MTMRKFSFSGTHSPNHNLCTRSKVYTHFLGGLCFNSTLQLFFLFQAALFAISIIFETYERVPVFVSFQMLDLFNRRNLTLTPNA